MYLNEKHVTHGDLKLENILVVCYDNKNNNKDEDGFINAIKHDCDILIKDGINKNSSNYFGNEVNEVNKALNERNKNEGIYSFGTNFKFGLNKNDKNNKSKNQLKLSLYDEKKLSVLNFIIKILIHRIFQKF